MQARFLIIDQVPDGRSHHNQPRQCHHDGEVVQADILLESEYVSKVTVITLSDKYTFTLPTSAFPEIK